MKRRRDWTIVAVPIRRAVMKVTVFFVPNKGFIFVISSSRNISSLASETENTHERDQNPSERRRNASIRCASSAVPAVAGVVVLHDVGGMKEDLRNQARWLARERFLAAAPIAWKKPECCATCIVRPLLCCVSFDLRVSITLSPSPKKLAEAPPVAALTEN
jgi:hypothetical protein